MNVTVGKKELLRVLKICKGVADAKSTMPVLANVLLNTRSDTLDISATDLAVSVRGQVDATVTANGAVAVNAKDLFDRVRAMLDERISLMASGDATLTVSAGAVKHILHGVEKEVFPTLPKPVQGTWASVEVDIVARLISWTFASISTDRTRIHLNSALFEVEENLLRMVTTDGHRMSKVEVRSQVSGSVSMLIPRDAVETLKRLCAEAKSGEVATFLKSDGFVHAYVAGFHFAAKLNDARFPPYESVIPPKYSGFARVNRKEFQACVARALAFASRKTDGLKLTLSNGEANINCRNFNSGAVYNDKIEADYAGEEFTMGLSARYLLDVLKSAEGDGTVALRINGSLDPISVMPSVSSPDYNHIAVIMPMRI